jgi:2-alkyl-3-oxoalkanoate reductase
MRVLITGATGFVGRRLAETLGQHGIEVTALVLPNEEDRVGDAFRYVIGDITRPETLGAALEGKDAVIHLAGAVGYGQDMALCQKVNVEGTRYLAEAAVAAGIKRFVHMSSVAVYGRVAGVVLAEDAPLRKIGDPYGDTKIDAEKLLLSLSRQGQLDLTVIRPTVIFGPGDDKFLPKLVENIRSGKAKVIGSGNNTVDLVHVDDVVAFISLALRESKTIGGTYNLTAPNDCTWGELVALVSDELGQDKPSGRIPYGTAWLVAGAMESFAKLTRRPPRLTRYAVRVIGRQYHYPVARAKTVGFEPQVDIREGISQCLQA